MFFYFAIFILLCLLAVFSAGSHRRKLVFSVFIGIMLVAIAGLRQPGVDKDSLTYVAHYNTIGEPHNYFTDFSNHYFDEAGYYLLPSVLVTYFGAGVVWFFLIMALLGVSFKVMAIWKLTEFQILSLLIYFCHFFLLHDMTQIRQGIASGILLISLVYIENKKLSTFLLLLAIGLFFHYSTLLFIPFYFLNPKKLNKAAFYAILLVPQLLYFFHINIINILLLFRLGILSEKLTYYNQLMELGVFSGINVYNSVLIVQLLFCVFLIWKADFFYSKNKYAVLCIKIFTIGLSSWVLFSSVPVIAFRISGFLEIVEIILVPFMLYFIEERPFAIAFVILYGFGLLYVDAIHSQLLNPYSAIRLLT